MPSCFFKISQKSEFIGKNVLIFKFKLIYIIKMHFLGQTTYVFGASFATGAPKLCHLGQGVGSALGIC